MSEIEKAGLADDLIFWWTQPELSGYLFGLRTMANKSHRFTLCAELNFLWEINFAKQFGCAA